VGWISADDGAHDVDIADIQILPAHQRKGHGRAAIGIVVREAFAAGRAVTLGVLKNNPARSLYERLGFAAIGATKTHVLMKLPYSPPDPAHSSVVPAAAQQRQPQQRTIAMPGFH
jgi:RimJ/RimL family protein N-acetyltransferase